MAPSDLFTYIESAYCARSVCQQLFESQYLSHGFFAMLASLHSRTSRAHAKRKKSSRRSSSQRCLGIISLPNKKLSHIQANCGFSIPYQTRDYSACASCFRPNCMIRVVCPVVRDHNFYLRRAPPESLASQFAFMMQFPPFVPAQIENPLGVTFLYPAEHFTHFQSLKIVKSTF